VRVADRDREEFEETASSLRLALERWNLGDSFTTTINARLVGFSIHEQAGRVCQFGLRLRI
jgi:hypothetical protein